MFYIITSIVIALVITLYCVLNYCVFKNNEKFKQITNKILKVAVVIYAVMMLLAVLLPDAFKLSFSQEELANETYPIGYELTRWFCIVSFITLPVAVFYNNRTIRNVAIYFGVAISIVQIYYYSQYLQDFTSMAGRGLNSIPVISQGFKEFLINPIFRSICFGLVICLQILIPVVLAVNDKHVFNFKNGKEYMYFFISLPFLILSSIPIYVPQHLFGYSSILLYAYSLTHFGWIFLVVCELIILYFLFRKQSLDTKMVLLFILSLSLIMQYLEMFSAISINIERLPFQLCNLGAFFILISLITKNRKLFNFTVIINVVGVIIAIAKPDFLGDGLFYLYNMHFIFEHTNVLIIPVLALSFGVFPRLDKKALFDCLLGFTIYFVCALFLGTMFNFIATVTENNFWYANYLFMFNGNKAADLLGDWILALFTPVNIGRVVLYPIIQLIIYCVFLGICVLLFFGIQLIYKIKDKIVANKKTALESETEQKLD